MAGGTFRLADIQSVVATVSDSVQYPLADAAALETALGGADAAVALGAEQHKSSEVRQIPADFFPIESAADLFTKFAFLRSANGDQAEDVAVGTQQKGPLPPGAGSPPQIPPDAIPTGRNVPSVRRYPR